MYDDHEKFDITEVKFSSMSDHTSAFKDVSQATNEDDYTSFASVDAYVSFGECRVE